MYRYGGNNADDILDPLSEEFKVDFVSEHDEEYDDYDHPDTPVRKINIEGLKNVQHNN